MRKVQVNVRWKHIKEGMRGNSLSCPIEKALCDRFKAPPVLSFSVFSTYISYGNHEYRSIPREARRFIDDFDKGKDVKPFCFKIEDFQLKKGNEHEK